MYNKEIKERFLNESQLQESTKLNYRYRLERAESVEEMLGKDIYEMTPYECDQLILSYSRKSKQTVFGIVSCLKKYLDFCIENNFVSDYFNYFGTLTTGDAVDKFVDKNAIRNKYIDLETLIEFEETLINAQDAVILELSFLGLKWDEILDLKVDDVKEDKLILSSREINIDDRSYQLINEACEQKYYDMGNGEEVTSYKGKDIIINETEYVVRPAGSTKSGQMMKNSLYGRFNRMKAYLDAPYLNMGNVWQSGMLHKLKEIKETKGELTKREYQQAHKSFGYSENYWFQSKMRFQDVL